MASDQRTRWSNGTFLVGFALTLILLGWICSRFLVPLVLALSAAILLSGLHEHLARLLRGRRGVSALLMSILALLALLLPLLVIGMALAQQLIPLLGQFVENIGSGRIAELARQGIPEQLDAIIDLAELEDQLRDALAGMTARLAGFVASIPARVVNLAIDGFVMFLALYAYFARGPHLAHAIVEATPMERRHTQKLLETISLAIRTVFIASFITAIVQFFLGYLAFRLVDAPYALALAGIMAFFSFVFSLVPILGSGLIWGPMGFWLLLAGRPLAGAFILAWGVVVLGSVDNVVKPLYARGQLKLSPLLVLITLFGGISVFGPIGALLGPLVAALAAAFLRIWTTEFLVDAEPLPRMRRPEQKKGGGPRLAWLRRTLHRLRRSEVWE
jgi:predicted PurR-regulated permease PerM